jgi:hypothetical protein
MPINFISFLYLSEITIVRSIIDERVREIFREWSTTKEVLNFCNFFLFFALTTSYFCEKEEEKEKRNFYRSISQASQLQKISFCNRYTGELAINNRGIMLLRMFAEEMRKRRREKNNSILVSLFLSLRGQVVNIC